MAKLFEIASVQGALKKEVEAYQTATKVVKGSDNSSHGFKNRMKAQKVLYNTSSAAKAVSKAIIWEGGKK